MSSPKFPDLIAHRGNAAEFPENTLPSLRSALELGASHVEFDVQLSSDRHPILLNDSDLKRTAGIERHAYEMTGRELADVVVNEPQRFQGRYGDVGIPTLAQAVGLLATYPAATAFIDLKRASLRTFGHEIVVHKVCEAVKPIARQCVIVSFDLAAIHHVRQVSSSRIGWMLAEYTSLSALKCEALAPDYVFCDHQLLTEGASKLWRGPWRWAIYDVNSPKLALQVAARGARLVATPSIREMLREFRGTKMRA
jgi:glycerophosphoryl diester phosphodiesterase